mmetsp:Transcript_113072/g.350993  ORF Transcript_113072/g.350993 Transcript_113072/m.350993 type:complete len:256 (+) Transcript_113072:1380-2147(+)
MASTLAVPTSEAQWRIMSPTWDTTRLQRPPEPWLGTKAGSDGAAYESGAATTARGSTLDLFVWKHLGVSTTPSEGVASTSLKELRAPGEGSPKPAEYRLATPGETSSPTNEFLREELMKAGDLPPVSGRAMLPSSSIIRAWTSAKPRAWKSRGTVATASVGVDSGSETSEIVREMRCRLTSTSAVPSSGEPRDGARLAGSVGGPLGGPKAGSSTSTSAPGSLPSSSSSSGPGSPEASEPPPPASAASGASCSVPA